MTNRQSKFHLKYALKMSSEYTQANFTWVISLFLTLIFLFNSFDFATKSVKQPVFIVAVIYLIFTVLQMIVTFKIKSNLEKDGEIRSSTRKFGYVLLVSILTGNIFIGSFACILIKQKKTNGYVFAVYTVLVDLFIIGISLISIFKAYVTDTFPLAMLLLFGVTIIHLLVLFVVSANRYKQKSWMKWIVLLLILTSFTGNIFALLLGIHLWIQIKGDQSNIQKWDKIWGKITQNNAAMIGFFFIVFIFFLSVYSPLTFDYDLAVENNYQAILQEPSLEYPFGTDNFGRDVFSRIIFGARISLIVGLASTLIPAIIGGFLGAVSGYYGKRTDNIIMRFLDILFAVPGILLAIAIIAAFGANTVNLILALSVGSIPTYARTMRANVLMVSNFEYVESARALGASDYSIIFKHVVPNSLAPMIVKATLTIGGAVIATSSLSFLGLGVEPHIPEWGNILKLGSTYLETNPYLAIYPGLAIILLVLSFNFLGDALRDALDPKLD